MFALAGLLLGLIFVDEGVERRQALRFEFWSWQVLTRELVGLGESAQNC